MNYALCENERVSGGLEQFADWMKEKDKSIKPSLYKRLVKVADKIIECAHEFDEIVEDYYKDYKD